jgi:hypothetical protein
VLPEVADLGEFSEISIYTEDLGEDVLIAEAMRVESLGADVEGRGALAFSRT